MKFRMLIVALFLFFTAWVVNGVDHGRPVGLRHPLGKLPSQVGPWQGQEVKLSPRITAKLHASDYLFRSYTTERGDRVDLYVAYYESQEHGRMIHSPKNCLPGNGWFIAQRSRAGLKLGSHPPMEVNRFLIENGSDRELVLYWYEQSGGRTISNEFWGRVVLVYDAFVRNRTDAALIRVSIPIEKTVEESFATGVRFLELTYPALLQILPDRHVLRPRVEASSRPQSVRSLAFKQNEKVSQSRDRRRVSQKSRVLRLSAGGPEGRLKIAQRFIAGFTGLDHGQVPEGRPQVRYFNQFGRPCRDLDIQSSYNPSDKSLGYFQSALRASRGSADKQRTFATPSQGAVPEVVGSQLQARLGYHDYLPVNLPSRFL